MKLLSQTIRMGQMLVQAGHLTEEQLAEALRRQKSSSKRLGELLVEEQLVSEAVVLQSLSEHLGLPAVKLRPGLIDPLVVDTIDKEMAEQHLIIPMFRVDDTLTVAMAEPQALLVVDDLERATGLRILPVMALAENIREYIKKYYAQNMQLDSFMASLEDAHVEVIEREAIDEDSVIDLSEMADGSPVVNLVNMSIVQAVKEGASDIHVEPDKHSVRIRYRIDGVLHDLMTPPKEWHPAIVSRIKVVGRMDIAEKRVPQEGRIHILIEGREIDLRISSMPTILGEKIVMRILDKNNLQLNLDRLGYDPKMVLKIKRMLAKPYGLFLVTGPTGSGKTTTLYSALDLLRNKERNILTIEDPVEYQLGLVNQIQVHEAVGLSFARTLRSVLRQDPDIIMVGEIRDEETAKVAVQAALTGHLVLSTLHTNDSAGTINRLLDMGIEPYLLASCLVGVIAQRLVRTICPKCKTTYFPEEGVLTEIGWQGPRNRAFHRGMGCSLCHDSGYRGRRAICEVLEVTPALRNLILQRPGANEINEMLSRQRHWWDLKQAGLLCVEQGVTSIDEMMRVCFLDEQEDESAPETPEESVGTDIGA
ncbi:MAG: Flp pilus assembly complex ATPase component TadA [Sedimentisphaerales bacterium]|nr:Flp pilus assembly complex ATPase component TadA [Sedimentisphaerales bacterium]